MQLLLATTNAGKIRELKELLGADYQILSLKDFPDIPPAVENGTSFAENALIKARLAAAHKMCIRDRLKLLPQLRLSSRGCQRIPIDYLKLQLRAVAFRQSRCPEQ